ncbi:ArsR/SmtB family transcription factor [Streptomyces sp. NPDC090036]|uniref:ArsR/SmtB family transcription factor n=1 Tax=Streptomyces sp. NPDC090036 TaxID=3365926 RepID=UPI0038114E12
MTELATSEISTSCCPSPLSATEAAELAAAFKALADPVRLRIASIVACCPAGEVCMGEIASEFSLSGPTISHHLKKLREAGVLDSERRANEIYYFVRPERLDALIGPLAALRAAVRPETVA